jgi:hypothetical protein
LERERDQQVLIERPVRLMDGVPHIRRLAVEAIPPGVGAVPARLGEG